ncbi:DUF2625 domain-containing protein [Hymenobacter gummosus]|uniref:DUF2625 domain-containing protein n=1 Tax=Hymenobacter gummosus TaxID=1776032 RepID=A0A3S0JJ15_9BACT|nr:DUF2625 domain-containing protein [Hymenobacter gummosus]RTQ51667.1 DUF2625 domain-containing protein [Hymenobacter gummosus]
MRTLSELVDTADPGWPLVQGWLAEARNPVDVLPIVSRAQAEQALLAVQVTTRSPMGALVYETGGLLIDSGWLRVLGSGHPRLSRSLPGWNEGRTSPQPDGFLLVADDVLGGFFALNGGALGPDLGHIYYFAPDRLAWEPLELGYSDFLNFCLNGDLDQFYEGQRWPGWAAETRRLDGSQGWGFVPFLWLQPDGSAPRRRQAVPLAELWTLEQDMARQLGPPPK